MKYILALTSILCLASCDSPDVQRKAAAIINRSLLYANEKGKISDEDLGLVRDLNAIVLTPSKPTEPLPEITVTSGK